MKRLYRIAFAAVLSPLLLLAVLWLAIPYWLPRVLAVWLPDEIRLTLTVPRVGWHSVRLADVRLFAAECQLAQLTRFSVSYSRGWQLRADGLNVDDRCFSKLPASHSDSAFSLAAWQAALPPARVHIGRVTLAGLTGDGAAHNHNSNDSISKNHTTNSAGDYAGSLTAQLSKSQQQVSYQSGQLALTASLRGDRLTVSQLRLTTRLPDAPQTSGALTSTPIALTLTAKAELILNDAGLPVQGRLNARLPLPSHWQTPVSLPTALYASLQWRDGRGQLLINAPDNPQPLLDLPWQLTADTLTIADGRWYWSQPMPLSGRLALTVRHWRQGLAQAQISARLSVLTQGAAGKGNAVLTLGPGKLDLAQNVIPLRLNGQANYQALQFYASLPAELRGDWQNPQLQLLPGALLRSKGQLINGLNIEQIRWPLAGINLSAAGVNGRLQAILRGHDAISGDFALHLDGQAQNFLPDKGLWQWKYWGQGTFTPTQTRWKTYGGGEWRDNTLTLTRLVSDFDQFRYAGMRTGATRLTLRQPIVWLRDAHKPRLAGELLLNTAATTFAHGGGLPPSTLDFSVNGSDPNQFSFRGDWRAAAIGPAQVYGRWDGTRLRGQAWWPAQPLSVFQPLLAPATKITLDGGQFYAQVAFSAAAGQGLLAGGHAVVKNGGGWLDHISFSGVDFTLPFSYGNDLWQLGPRQPVMLRIGDIGTPLPLEKLTADLQGWYPWSEARPLILSNVRLRLSAGELSLQQLRLPQHQPALLRLNNIETSYLISALNVKSFALSGRVNGALPLWLNHTHWFVHQGWLTNPSALTLRMNDDLINGMVKNNGEAASVINWLRYLEINPHAWISVNLDRQGALSMSASVQGTGEVDGKRGSVRLNYHHQDNMADLWRNLRFADDLQNWLRQRLTRTDTCCQPDPEQKSTR